LDLARVPRCVCHDAGEFLPREIADRWSTSNGPRAIPAISSLFRYKLLFEKGGWYFDMDCILVKPLTSFFDLDYVFAWENAWNQETQSSTMVSNAVLKFPKNTQMLDLLYKYCIQIDPKTWQPGGLVPIFTEYLQRFNLIKHALDPEYFYPISSFSQFQQQSTSADRTHIVHLFHQILSNRELDYQKQIKALNNSLSLKIGRNIPFGKTIRRAFGRT
jgi:hypothetical protein